MNKITFPGIGINFNINKIAFTIGNTNIYWYAIIIVTAIAVAVIFCKKKNGKYNIKFDNILELLLYLIPVSIITARIYYVIFNWNYYNKNILQIFNIKNGGIAIYGALIGGAITTYIYCQNKKIDFLNLLDYIVPSVAIAQSIGRWGNFINIEAYGIETRLPWRMGIFENGLYKEVHPTFLYESIATLVIFMILKNKKRKFKGEILYLYIILYSFVRFFIESIRIDSLMLYNARISQILSMTLFVVFCIILSKKHVKENKSQKI